MDEALSVQTSAEMEVVGNGTGSCMASGLCGVLKSGGERDGL